MKNDADWKPLIWLLVFIIALPAIVILFKGLAIIGLILAAIAAAFGLGWLGGH